MVDLTTSGCPWLVWEAVKRRAQEITQIRQACQQSWKIREKRASIRELIQSWLSFSGVFPFGGPSKRASAERSWAPDRMRQVKRP